MQDHTSVQIFGSSKVTDMLESCMKHKHIQHVVTGSNQGLERLEIKFCIYMRRVGSRHERILEKGQYFEVENN